MSKVNELRNQRAKAWEQAKAFLDSHRNEKGILSAEDTAAYERMEQEIVDLGHEIERQERADALERELAAPVSTPAHVFNTSNGTHKIPVVVSKGSAAWIDENGAYTESDDVFGMEKIDAHKVGTIIKVSEELLYDSAFDLENYFREEFARRIGDCEEDAFLNGNGTKKPTGLLNTTGGAEVGVTAASATAITADELIDLFYSLKSPYRKNAIWIMNDATIRLVRKLKDGNGQYLWQPALREGEFDTILGKKIYTSPFMPTAAAGAKTISVIFLTIGSVTVRA